MSATRISESLQWSYDNYRAFESHLTLGLNQGKLYVVMKWDGYYHIVELGTVTGAEKLEA